MRELNADITEKIGRAAMAAGAKVIRDRARTLAPISDAPHQLGVRKNEIAQPGNLRKNIITKRLQRNERSLTQQYIVKVRQGSGKAGKDAFYWSFVEFGTVKMAAQPFMRPAFEGGKEKAVEKIKERLKSRIDRANKVGK